MSDEDYALYQQAVQLANSGQRQAAYQQFTFIRGRGNEDIELLFWLAKTTPYQDEAERILAIIARREPNHPSLPAARREHAHKSVLPVGGIAPLASCPYCQTQGSLIVQKRVSTAGWAVFVVLLLSGVGTLFCWAGLLIQQEYKECQRCGVRF